MQASVTKPDEVVVVRLVTTSAGNVGGTTLVCSTLTSWPNLDGSSVKILSGSYKGQSRAISGSTITGTITVSPAFSGQIAAGVKFSIVGLPSTAVDVAAINGKIGTNADAAGTTTLFARLRQVVDTYLADGTIGLAALQTLLTAEAAALTTLLSRLTAARASYLDNINNTQLLNIPNLSTLTPARIAYLDYINNTQLLNIPNLSTLTPARIAYLDNINNAQLLNIPNLTAVTRELLGFVGGVVFVDDAGAVGTAWPLGTATDPTSTVANGVTIAAANRLVVLHVKGLHTIASNISGYLLHGLSGPFAYALLTLAPGVNNTNTTFERCIITGAANGIAYYENYCILYNLSGVDGTIRNSDIGGTITLAAPTLTYIDMNNITTMLGPVTIDCTNLGAGDNLRIHNFTGSLTLTNLTANATVRIYSSSGAHIATAASCTAGTVEVNGSAEVTDGGGTTIVDNTIQAALTAIQAKTDLMNSALGTATLNDANPADTIVPTSLPTKMHLVFDISNLNNNGDNFDISVSVGTAGNERIVAWYNLTSDGTDITMDPGSGVATIISQRRLDLSNILVYSSEQVIVSRTKNSVTDRNVEYKYLCGV
jgi:hypothetical protein